MSKLIRCLLALTLLLAGLCHAAALVSVNTLQPHAMAFEGARFGQPPLPTMELQRQTAATAYARYRQPAAPATLDSVAITPPTYNYWHNRLFRITFGIVCTPETETATLRQLRASLDRSYGLTQLESRRVVNLVHGIEWTRELYITRQGAVLVLISQQRDGDTWQPPLASLNDMGAREALALTANPRYLSWRLMAPQSALAKL